MRLRSISKKRSQLEEPASTTSGRSSRVQHRKICAVAPVFLRSRKPQVVKFQEVSDLATTRGRKKVQEAAGGMEAVSGSGLCFLLLLLVDVLSCGSSGCHSCLSGSSLLQTGWAAASTLEGDGKSARFAQTIACFQ